MTPGQVEALEALIEAAAVVQADFDKASWFASDEQRQACATANDNLRRYIISLVSERKRA